MPVAEKISPKHWNWVRNLIREIEREEMRDEFLKQFFQWDLGIKEFRKVEMARMIQGEPSTVDFHFHAICLHSLLAIGHSLILQSEDFEKKGMEHFHVEDGHIEGYLGELEQSYREWHHGFKDAEVQAAQRVIFGVEA